MSGPIVASRKRFSVHPHHQPRRGGIISAGAARPRDSKKEKLPPIPTGGSRYRPFDTGPPGLKTILKSWPSSGVFAVRSINRTRLICISGQLPHDDSTAPTATHTLQESCRVCESIAWLAGRGDFARGSAMKRRHDSIVAIGNTPEPNADGRTKPPLPTSPPSLRVGGEEQEKRRLIGLMETGGSRHRHFDAGPPGLKIASGTPCSIHEKHGQKASNADSTRSGRPCHKVRTWSTLRA